MASSRTSLPEGPGLDILEGSKGVPHQFFGWASVAIGKKILLKYFETGLLLTREERGWPIFMHSEGHRSWEGK